MSATIDPELHAVKRLAEEIAQRRREPATGAHLLAAIASRPGATADLLNERRLNARALLTAFDALQRPLPDESLKHILGKSRQLAQRTGSHEVSSPHLLMAMLSDTRGIARLTVAACGADAGRLRTAALNLSLGIIGKRRTVDWPHAGVRASTNGRPRRDEAQLSLPHADVEPAPSAARRPPPVEGAPKAGANAPPQSMSSKLPPGISGRVPRPRGKVPQGVVVPVMPSRPLKPAPWEQPQRAQDSTNPAPGAAPGDNPSATEDARRSSKSDPASTDPVADRFGLDRRLFPTLIQLGKNLTLAAAKGDLDPVVGRDREIEQALDVLAKRQGNNPCLVGEAGVGKTSVVRGLAQAIAAGEGVHSLDDRLIVEIPIGELLAGTGVRGALAGRLQALQKEVKAAAGRVVLFFDEMHQLFVGEGSDEIATELKLALARGDLPCIGATTAEEYQRAVERDAALARRFSIVEVGEPSREDAFLILDALSRRFETHHGVCYARDALALSINWSVRYLPGRALPDKAVSIIDLAGARVRRRGGSEVDVECVAEVVAALADMPVERLLESDGERMLNLEKILAERIVGHEDHIQKIAKILRRNAAGLSGLRPIGTFLLLGPTGVGKTETAKAIAEVLFQTEGAMTRIDLSEYSEGHSVAKLIGAPPGYVGHEAGGQLTEAVRRRPYQVVLLDEIEKAHPDVLTTFLAVFDEGRMTDGRGRLVDFTNTVILMTSNIGAEVSQASAKRRVGFMASDDAPDAPASKVVAAARAHLPPELYNRIDEILAFSPLTRDDVHEIARRMLAKIQGALVEQRGVKMDVEGAAIEALLDSGGFEPSLGARPMKRAIQRLIEAPLAEKLLKGELSRGDVLLVSAEEGELSLDVLDASPGQSAAE